MFKFGIIFVCRNRLVSRPSFYSFGGFLPKKRRSTMSGRVALAKVYDDIIKPPGEKRNYRGLLLSNDMKVLLISDPETDKAAASMNVHVGFMSDPEEVPGLAHFCEHMLFMGTEKFPLENDYLKFLNEHGGRSNAHTSLTNTTYYFDIDPQYLRDALDRFSQFFICPLFNEETTEREIKAIHSEFEKNLNSDSRRLFHLEKATCDPTHSYHRFGSGNQESLIDLPQSHNINLREALLEFHKSWYSSNIMSLVIFGKESLEELTELVDLFAPVANKEVELPSWPQHPFGPDQLKLEGLVVPVKDLRSLKVTFPLPDLHSHYKESPTEYIAHLVGHEGPGSLLSEFKLRGWATSLSAGYREGAPGFAFFDIKTNLTKEGIDHTDEMIELIFGYLSLLKASPPQRWFFEELCNLSHMVFRFKDMEQPLSIVSKLAPELQMYPMEEVLSGPCLISNFDPSLISEVLAALIPDKIRVAVVGKKFEGLTDSTEKWYGIDYKLSPISESKLEKWRKVHPHPNLAFPPPNEFIPTNFDLTHQLNQSINHPSILKNTPRCRLWYLQDKEFFLPKAILRIQLQSHHCHHCPIRLAASLLFVMLFKDALNEYAYSASIAGLTYVLHALKKGLSLTLMGYNDKLPILLQKVMDRLVDFKVDPKRFAIFKEEHLRHLSNFEAEQPYSHAQYLVGLALTENSLTIEENIEAVQEITVAHVESLLAELCSRMHLESLFFGNLSPEEAFKLLDIVESRLDIIASKSIAGSWKPLFPSLPLHNRQHQLPDGSSWVVSCVNGVHPCGAVETLLQCGRQSTHTTMLTQLAQQVVSEACFNILRTQEQLGYIVHSSTHQVGGTVGLQIIVQSAQDPALVDARIDSFLLQLKEILTTMSPEDFENHKRSLEVQRLVKPKRIYERFTKVWAEIMTQQYNFEKDEIEVNYLKTLTKDQLSDFIETVIVPNGVLRKKIAAYVLSEKAHGLEVSKDKLPIESTLVENIPKFKAHLSLYPIAEPSMDVQPPFVSPPLTS